MTTREDENQEVADIRRLRHAGEQNDDPETTAAAVRRADRLARELGTDITNPVLAKLTGLDTLPRSEI